MKIQDLIRKAVSRRNSAKSMNPSDLAISKLGKERRQQLRRDWNVRSMPPAQRVGVERAINARVRDYLKPLRDANRRLTAEEQIIILRGIRPSKVLDRLYPNRLKPGRWLKLTERDASRPISEIEIANFSFLSDPKGTIAGLQKIAQAEATAPGAKIHFLDPYCLDVAPFMLLAECWNEMLPIFEGGKMSLPLQKVIAAVGVQHAMGIGLRGVNEFSDVWAFPLARRRGAGSTTSRSPFLDVQSREVASDEFCDALNGWLRQAEKSVCLTKTGVWKIKNLLGELLENAERHSDGERRDGSWSVSGFMARRYDDEAEEWVYRAHFGIISIGDTFSKSLDRALPDLRAQLDLYVDKMRKKGAKQSAKTLRTLAALQDGVTCFAEADADYRGGFGLQEMLELVSILGETSNTGRRPRVTILSGSSCIKLQDPYLKGHQKSPDDSTRVLWCNQLNSNDELPDEEYVFDIEPGLPGTVISVGFVLDPDYLRSATSEGDESNEKNRTH